MKEIEVHITKEDSLKFKATGSNLEASFVEVNGEFDRLMIKDTKDDANRLDINKAKLRQFLEIVEHVEEIINRKES